MHSPPAGEQLAIADDPFETTKDGDTSRDVADAPEIELPETFDELPIEIRNLTERFLESLSAKVHPTPLTIDALSNLFQDFYTRAESHISTHIAILSSRLSREKSSGSATPPEAPKGGGKNVSASGKASPADTSGGEQQMLTASEVTDKRKARRLLELKRTALEEAVERGVCEKIYDRIWRHRSTDDEERDEKLRSRTAALSVVGIGLKELHVDMDKTKEELPGTAEEREEDIRERLAGARSSLRKMDDEKYPLGKLRHLTAAHKSIVETLSQLFPSSSSADEVLPTLIYTLITSPPEGTNVISNLNFIQRFRAASKVDGEAAYCLVNLEAAISFLETVDLSSLRADEAPEGPLKSASRSSTPRSERSPAPLRLSAPRSSTPGLSPISATSTDQSAASGTDLKVVIPPTPTTPPVRPVPPPHQRRLSSLIQTQTERIEAGRDQFLNTADQAFDTINSTLENSFKFLFGRLKEQQAHGDGFGSPPVLPITLEDARKLVSPTVQEDDAVSVSGGSSFTEKVDEAIDDPLHVNSTHEKTDSKVLDLIGGRRALRDRSVDSTKSNGSGKRVAFAEKGTTTTAASATAPKDLPAPTTTTNVGNAAVDTMRSLGNTLNPLNRFSNMAPSFRGFGRSSPVPATPSAEKFKQLGHGAEAVSLSNANNNNNKPQDGPAGEARLVGVVRQAMSA
ncbi:hypothetical protein B0A49_06744 [Cryomyces minteri]|uniref:VPS9 domain-containing protein n=1 Tax=Cryomyces minteri TaxID=331657 RepID=A0A4U0WS72_9PEZI|nr:hypothetical protein B0A49_06744 [Cryomyces minteri]